MYRICSNKNYNKFFEKKMDPPNFKKKWIHLGIISFWLMTVSL